MNDTLAKWTATCGTLGYFPVAAGSLSGMIGGILALSLRENSVGYLFILAVVIFIGWRSSARMEKILGEKDPSCIVIDELAGGMLAFFMLPVSAPVFWTAFFLFRAFDMFKIYPADELQNREKGAGVMLDDIVAGIYTNLIMHLAVRLVGLV